MLELFTSTRLQIMLKLRERPYTVSEIAKITGFSKTAISYHLEKLEENGLVERTERGKWVYYKLTSKGLTRMKLEAFASFASIIVSTASFFALVARFLLRLEEDRLKPAAIPEAPTPTKFPEIAKIGELIFVTPLEVFLIIIAVISFLVFLYFKMK